MEDLNLIPEPDVFSTHSFSRPLIFKLQVQSSKVIYMREGEKENLIKTLSRRVAAVYDIENSKQNTQLNRVDQDLFIEPVSFGVFFFIKVITGTLGKNLGP